MRILLLDTLIRYSPHEAHYAPLGGTETSFVNLAEALQARGHEVHVYLLDPGTASYRGVRYHRSEAFGNLSCDVVIARWPQLFERTGEKFRKRIISLRITHITDTIYIAILLVHVTYIITFAFTVT